MNLDGSLITDDEVRGRLDALTIPPAWEEVWINPDPEGHIQATGRDARQRKQYIYHRDWRVWRDNTKFEHILDFAERLPRLRRRVARDLGSRTLSIELVCAAAVRVLEETLMRVGNDEYAIANKTFGLTTLRRRHVKRRQGTALFSFVGKHGKPFEAPLADRRVRAILRRLEDLPGQHLFQYVDDTGEVRRIRSDEINSYIRDATGGDFTAKDFRTWSATVLAAEIAAAIPAEGTPTKRSVTEVVAKVARRLGNTPAVCRKSYIHPAVIEAWLDGSLSDFPSSASRPSKTGLSATERNVLQFLRKRHRVSRTPLKVKLVASIQAAA